MKPTLLIPLLLLSLPFALAQAQPSIRLHELKPPTATSIATIDCIFEDARGFIWLGTYSGLYRFDGYELTHYRHDPNDPNSISDNKIKAIVEDSQGNFWVGTQVGVNYFDRQSQQFREYTDTARCGLGKEMIYDLALDEQGGLWVASITGLYLFDPDREWFVKKFPENKDAKARVPAVEPAGQGVHFAVENQLLHASADQSPRKVADLPAQIIQLNVYGAQTWISTEAGMFLLGPTGQELCEITQLRGMSCLGVFPLEERFLLAAGKELFLTDAQGLQVEGPLSFTVPPSSSRPAEFWEIFTASNGITWFFDSGGKIFMRDARKERFSFATTPFATQLKSIAAICELFEYSPGELIVPGDEGAYLLELNTSRLKPFPHKPDFNREAWNEGPICYFAEPDSMLWIGTFGGLFLLDRKNGRFVNLEREFPELSALNDSYLRKIFRDRMGNLWVGTWDKGLFKINFEGKTIRQYNNSPEHRTAYMHHSRTIFETRSGDLWFGTRGGLMKYLPEKDSFLVYRNIPGDPTSMSENTSFCIYEDDDGNIWSGSYGGGLNYLDVKTGKFKHYTAYNGLLDNNVFSLLPDGKGNLWLSSFNGINVFNLATKTFRAFKRSQGLLNPAFNAFTFSVSRYSNTFFFVGENGVDFFNPDSVLVNYPAPKVWFTDFKLFNEPAPLPVGEGRPLSLRYDQNVLTFEYAALDYSSPETVQYAYWLEGFDKEWQYVGPKRSVTFTNLDPGKYTLKVKASNSDGVWDPAESNVRSLPIVVSPPWWRTWWFRISVLLFVGGLIFAFFNYRVRQIREREAIKAALNQRIAQVKMEALRSQMNPHFVFNCLSSLKLFVEKNETEKASDHISKFAALLRRVLDDARTETETVSLERELDTLRRYVDLEMIRFKDKFEFRMEIDPEIDIYSIKIPPLILQPYVENAILHGLQNKTDAKGLLLIRVEGKDELVKISVEDNGVGREAAGLIKARNPLPQQSHGLNVTAERLDYFSQKYGTHTAIETTDLFHADGTAAGTSVTLIIQNT